MKKILMLLITLAVASMAYAEEDYEFASPHQQYYYDDKVMVRGVVKNEYGYYAMYLQDVIDTLVKDPNDVEEIYTSHYGVNRVQAAWGVVDKKIPLDTCIIAEGHFFAMHTAHHKTDVLMFINDYQPCN